MDWKPYTRKVNLLAGMLLRTRCDDKIVLVGDVNELLGVCDDCKDFRHEDITHYATGPTEAQVIALKAELQVRTFMPGFPSRPDSCLKHGARTAFDTGFEKGWLNHPFTNPYTAQYCRDAHFTGYEQGARESAEEIARLIAQLTPVTP